jgi:hypothetical protein
MVGRLLSNDDHGRLRMCEMGLIEFVRRHIRSVWALEVLLLLRRQPLRAWSAVELIGELRASEAVVVGVLGGFESGGLVARDSDDRYRFAARKGIDALCDALAEAYRQRPRVVIKAISSPDSDISELANAFRIVKRPR